MLNELHYFFAINDSNAAACATPPVAQELSTTLYVRAYSHS
jgi:hypothetical protein